MNVVTVAADTEVEAGEQCAKVHGWTPDAIREVDSIWYGDADGGSRMWRCFEHAQDAAVWDKQK